MTSRIKTSLLRSADQTGDAIPATRIGWSEVPGRLRAALGLAVVGAALLVLGPATGLVHDAPAAGFAALPLLTALAVLPPLLALGFVVARAPATGAGVLVGAALLAPGRALVDAQLAVDPLRASRSEFLVPTSLAPLAEAPGVWLLLGGHVVTVLAGALAVGRAGAIPGTPYAAEFDDHSADRSTKDQGTSLLLALLAGLVAAVGLLLAPYGSDNAFVLANGVVNSPAMVRIGLLVLAGATAATAVFGAGSARPSVARGALLGVTVAVAGVTVPQIAAGLLVDRLRPAIGPYVALGAVAALTVTVWLLKQRPESDARDTQLDTDRLHPIAGVLGLCAAAATLAGGTTAQLIVADAPVGYSSRLLVPAAVLVFVLAVPLLVKRVAPAARPAFAVALAAIPVVGAGALDASFTATSASAISVTDTVRLGPGVWCTGLAILFAAAAAIVAALAGAVERDDVDMTDHEPNLTPAAPSAAAALLAIGAFGLPMITAPGLVAAGIWSNFRLASWGLLFAVLLVFAVVGLSTVSRPPRAGALLVGAAGVVGVHALEFALTADRAESSTVGPGTWLSVACAVALLIAAFVTVVARRNQPLR